MLKYKCKFSKSQTPILKMKKQRHVHKIRYKFSKNKNAKKNNSKIKNNLSRNLNSKKYIYKFSKIKYKF